MIPTGRTIDPPASTTPPPEPPPAPSLSQTILALDPVNSVVRRLADRVKVAGPVERQQIVSDLVRTDWVPPAKKAELRRALGS